MTQTKSEYDELVVDASGSSLVLRRQHCVLQGRGLSVSVRAEWTRAQIAGRLADLATDLLADLQADSTKDEALFFRAETARSFLKVAAEKCGEVDVPSAFDTDPMPPEPPQDPGDVVCPDCNADANRACRDQRPGRNLQAMKGYHPGRVEAFREVK